MTKSWIDLAWEFDTLDELEVQRYTVRADPLEGYKETELGLLPDDWDVTTLQETVDFTRKPRGLHLSDLPQIAFIPMDSIPSDGTLNSTFVLKTGDSISSGTYCEAGDLLLAKITPSLENGKQGMVPTEVPSGFAVATTEVYPLKPNRDRLDDYFFSSYLRYRPVRRSLASKMEGSTGRQRLPKHVLMNLPLPVPPLPEQRAIAEILHTVQAAREATERVISATQDLKRSLMDHLFAYGPVTVNEAERVPLKETEIGPVPEHWEVVRLGDVAHKPEYGYTASAAESPVGPKFLRITDIQNDQVNWSTVPFCECSEKDSGKYKLEPGDIVFARIGATTGKSYLLEEVVEAVYASYLIRVRTTERVDSRYLAQFTRTAMYWTQINANKGGRLKQGVNIPVLNNLLLPLPSLSEQQNIAHILGAVDEKIKAEERRRQTLEVLFKTLLHNLMTGRVRVQDLDLSEVGELL